MADDLIGQDYRTPGEVRAMARDDKCMIRITDDGHVAFDPDLVVTRDGDKITLTAPWAGDGEIIVSPLTTVNFTAGQPSLNLYDVITEAFPA